MQSIPPYPDALARVRDVFVFHAATPSFLTSSLELEDCTHAAARAALRSRVPFAALCADLGRIAAETLDADRLGAITVGRAMAHWAARVYRQTATDGVDESR